MLGIKCEFRVRVWCKWEYREVTVSVSQKLSSCLTGYSAPFVISRIK